MLAAAGQLRLGVASVGETAIAAQVWIVQWRQGQHLQARSRRATGGIFPGTLLTAHLMEHVIEQDGVREVIFHRRRYLQAYLDVPSPGTLGIVAYIIQRFPRRNHGLLAECGERAAKRPSLVSDRRENWIAITTGILTAHASSTCHELPHELSHPGHKGGQKRKTAPMNNGIVAAAMPLRSRAPNRRKDRISQCQTGKRPSSSPPAQDRQPANEALVNPPA